jgi:Ca2+-binding RTX toxin-like protein
LDTIYGGSGGDIVFGDHGRIDQSAGTLRLLTTAFVTRIATAESANGAADYIEGNAGNDILLGGTAGDTIHAGADNNIVIGDLGFVDYVIADLDLSDIDRIESTSTTVDGGADTITANGGDDIVIGGRYGDTINAGDGANLVIGDSGKITAATSNLARFGAQPITLGLVETIAFDDGGVDLITTGIGNDIVLGGDEGDTITVSSGHNLVLGDDGRIDYVRQERAGSVPGADTDASDIDLIESLSTNLGGGVDNITTNGGDDIVIGGRFNDTLNAGDGSNLVIGDSGRITAANGNAPRQLPGQPVTLGLIETITFSDGGIDTISTGVGNDIVFGGMAGDVINAGSGQNIVLGDDGQIDYVRFERDGSVPGADQDASDIDLIQSVSTAAYGGADTITVNGGNDIIIGGRAGDSITAGAGTDLVIGDSGRITAADSASTLPQFPGLPVTIARLESHQHDDGGNDTIYGNAGNDVILGGFGADKLYGNGGAAITTPDADTILGDNAALFDVDLVTAPILRAAKVQTTDLVSSTGGNDTISGNEDDDVLLGGVGDDLIDGNSGRDLILGDRERWTAGHLASTRIRVTGRLQGRCSTRRPARQRASRFFPAARSMVHPPTCRSGATGRSRSATDSMACMATITSLADPKTTRSSVSAATT